MSWPATAAELEREQKRLAALEPPLWRPEGELVIAGCFVCFPRGERRGPGARGDPAWAAATAMATPGGGAAMTMTGDAVVAGVAGAPYVPGLLALREGPLLERAVRALPVPPDVLLVDAMGRDHPRRAGLALQLGAVLELPTIGVTHRALLADGEPPADTAAGASSPLAIDATPVALWLRTRAHVRPLAIHPAWRTDEATAREVVLAAVGKRARTPEPLRTARRLARRARSSSGLG